MTKYFLGKENFYWRRCKAWSAPWYNTLRSTMELFSRRRWATGSAQQSTLDYAMYVLHKFFRFNINTTAFCLGRSSLHLLILKSSMEAHIEGNGGQTIIAHYCLISLTSSGLGIKDVIVLSCLGTKAILNQFTSRINHCDWLHLAVEWRSNASAA